MAFPEHNFQTKVKQWVRDCVAEPHVLLAHDRTHNHGTRQHIYEAARGIVAGTPDTQLLVRGRSLWVELKVKGGVLSPTQKALHPRMAAVGHPVSVAYSVTEYMGACLAAGVKLTAHAAMRAQMMDALLEAARPVKPPSKPRAARKKRPSSKALAVARKVYGL